MLTQALGVSSTGIQAASTFLDSISNNIANSNTTGYKTSQVSFQDLFYSTLTPTGAPSSGQSSPGSLQLGLGVATAATTGVFTQGTIAASGGQFDVAISGQGFLSVNLPGGQTGYTRAGNLSLDSAGNIVTADGFIVTGGVKVPSGASTVSIAPGGLVTATLPSGAVETLGQLTLTEFTNPAGLTRIGNTTFAQSTASGTPVVGDPGTNGLGTLQQGSLEGSNVNLNSELTNLIVAQQAFNFNVNALTVENQTLQDTVQIITATG
jgi:flagellar basal-body rod protein FlgG